MKKRLTFFIAILMTACILTLTASTSATLPAKAETGADQEIGDGSTASKEEVIYSTLSASGQVNQIYAVNILDITKAGKITDYGSYSSVKNLTGTDIPQVNDDSVNVAAPAGRFYYQGNMVSKSLPWNIAVTYLLDNEPITADALAGKSGHLEIRIKSTQNPDIDPLFFNHYLLQITVTLDTGKCTNIAAKGANLANAGSDKLATFTVLPAKEGNLSVSADVADFEMKGIQISGVPFSMNIELPDTASLTGDLSLLSDAIKQLNDGISSLGDGIFELNSGSVSLKHGSLDFKDGLDELSSQSDALVGASSKISSALSGISDMLAEGSQGSDLSGLSKLPGSLSALADGLDQISKGLSDLGTGYSAAFDALDEAISSIPDKEIKESSLQSLLASNPDDKTINQLVQYYTAARRVKETYQAVSAVLSAVDSSLSTMSSNITDISGSLNLISEQLSSGSAENDFTSALSQLSAGITELSGSYHSFHEGLASYTGGVLQLASSYDQLNLGISDLSEGTGKLDAGMTDLENGAEELEKQTDNMPQQIETAVSDILADYDTSGFIPESFTSKNNKVTSVQFILRTEPVNKPKVPEETDLQASDETFWTRLKNLF